MFNEQGFDAVTVTAVAEAADVSLPTVFKYFPTKEDLFFEGIDSAEGELLAAIRDRPAGQPIVAAAARFLLQRRPGGLLATASDEATQAFVKHYQIIANSPSLLRREREIFARYAELLGELIAEDTSAKPGDLRPWVVAHAVIAIHKGLIDFVRRHVLDESTDLTPLSRAALAKGRQAFALLEEGLADYGAKPLSYPRAAQS
jgi:AcrR family transcriptional regulator